MDNLDVILLGAGLLQLGVAGYALRLGRIFGTVRLGRSVCCGLSLLALGYLILSAGYRTEGGTKVDVIYALSSGTLLVGMALLETLLREHQKQMAALAKANNEWPKAHEGLQQMVARLHAEVTEQKRLAAELTKTNIQLQQAADELPAEAVEQKPVLAEAEKPAAIKAACRTCQDELTRKNSDMLINASAVLGHVNDSLGLAASHLAQSKISHVSRLAKLLREHAGNLGQFLTRDPQGRQLPVSLAQLTQRLSREHSTLSKQIDSAKKHIEQVRKNLSAQPGQDPDSIETAGIDDAGDYALHSAYTETATDSLELDQENETALNGTDPEERPDKVSNAEKSLTYSDDLEARA